MKKKQEILSINLQFVAAVGFFFTLDKLSDELDILLLRVFGSASYIYWCYYLNGFIFWLLIDGNIINPFGSYFCYPLFPSCLS